MFREDNKQTNKYAIICPFNGVNKNTGLGAIVRYVMAKTIKAVELGYIPIVDLKNLITQYIKDDRKFKDNAWEYFFKQPYNFSLDIIDEIENSQIVQWESEIEYDYPLELDPMPLNKQNIEQVQHLNDHIKYLQFSDELQKYIDENYKKIVGDETEILGIAARGTDYKALQPYYHPIPAKTSQLINEAKSLIKKYHYKKIYVATEDKQIYETFKKEFGDMLLPNIQYMYDKYENAENIYLARVKVNRPNNNYLLGMEYLLSMYILSRCKSFIASNCGAVYFVGVLSKCYKDMEYVHVWDRGRYKYGTKIGYSNFWQRIFSVKNEVYENIVRKVITILGIKIKFIKEIK